MIPTINQRLPTLSMKTFPTGIVKKWIPVMNGDDHERLEKSILSKLALGQYHFLKQSRAVENKWFRKEENKIIEKQCGKDVGVHYLSQFLQRELVEKIENSKILKELKSTQRTVTNEIKELGEVVTKEQFKFLLRQMDSIEKMTWTDDPEYVEMNFGNAVGANSRVEFYSAAEKMLHDILLKGNGSPVEDICGICLHEVKDAIPFTCLGAF